MKKFLIFLVLFANLAQADLVQDQVVNTSVKILEVFDYDFFKKTNHAKLPKHFKKHQIKAIAIFPDLIKTGLVASVQVGKGILCVRDDEGKWQDPLFVDIKGLGFGLQGGYLSNDAVFLFSNHRSYSGIFKGSLTFGIGGDASIGGGKSSHNLTDIPQLGADILALGRSDGVFLGLSLESTQIRINDQDNIDYYDRMYKYEDIINGSPKDSKYTKKLKKRLYETFE